jgi:hypothetical protein
MWGTVTIPEQACEFAEDGEVVLSQLNSTHNVAQSADFYYARVVVNPALSGDSAVAMISPEKSYLKVVLILLFTRESRIEPWLHLYGMNPNRGLNTLRWKCKNARQRWSGLSLTIVRLRGMI